MLTRRLFDGTVHPARHHHGWQTNLEYNHRDGVSIFDEEVQKVYVRNCSSQRRRRTQSVQSMDQGLQAHAMELNGTFSRIPWNDFAVRVSWSVWLTVCLFNNFAIIYFQVLHFVRHRIPASTFVCTGECHIRLNLKWQWNFFSFRLRSTTFLNCVSMPVSSFYTLDGQYLKELQTSGSGSAWCRFSEE